MPKRLIFRVGATRLELVTSCVTDQQLNFEDLCFQNNKFYPEHQNTIGEKLRVTRMQNFLSINQLAKQLKVDPTSVNRWEIEKSQLLPQFNKKIMTWINQSKVSYEEDRALLVPLLPRL